MHEDLFLKMGLSRREVIIYQALLRYGELMASELSKKTEIIRTNGYDILHSLIKKGLVSYVVRNNKKYFRPTDPEKLIDYLNTKQEDMEELKLEIKKILSDFRPPLEEKKHLSIEIYEGKEGLKTILGMSIRESLRTGKEILGISVQQQKCRKLGGVYHVRWYKEREKQKIKSRYLVSAKEKIIPIANTVFKKLPSEARNPNEIFIFGNITTQFFFIDNAFSAIVINNKKITDDYRNYFNFIWNLIK